MTALPTWGLVATIKAEAPDILRFAAHHIDLGAHRLYLYLDAPCPAAFPHLKAHPKIRPVTCDAAHWKKLAGARPDAHQHRQAINATHAYNRPPEVDWLIHLDVDEFLVPDRSVADHLADVNAGTRTARLRPMELLAGGDGRAYKAFIPPGPDRAPLVDRLYPTFGRYLRGGFMSHLGGKLFVRTGLPGVKLRIHRAFQNDRAMPDTADLTGMSLAHHHARAWESWRSSFGYRLQHGTYRADLDRGRNPESGDLSLHELFNFLIAESGEDGLRAFFDEVAADTPSLRARLDQAGLLRIADLALDTVTRKHFTQTA